MMVLGRKCMVRSKQSTDIRDVLMASMEPILSVKVSTHIEPDSYTHSQRFHLPSPRITVEGINSTLNNITRISTVSSFGSCFVKRWGGDDVVGVSDPEVRCRLLRRGLSDEEEETSCVP